MIDESSVTRQAFQLHLPGLLKVLAEHLYTNKSVGVRELLQNAHDSCVRRSVEERFPGYRPRIDVTIDRTAGILTIDDNGSGLTREEVVDYLSTIGKSYTRDLKEQLTLLSPDEAAKLIGQFGLGFLSAFLLASEVTVQTRSHQPGHRPVRWHCTGDEEYELTTGTRTERGTSVTLRLKPGAAYLLQAQLLADTIRKYADFLPTPIYLDGERTPTNFMTPPWEAADPAAATFEYIARRFGEDEPLCVIPLHDGRVSLGYDAVVVPLRGFLFIPQGSVASVREWGDLTVFIRRMFITDNERDLLPPWARFVRGVVESPALQPTASREGIHQDDEFASVRRVIEEQLGTSLRDLARNDPTAWQRIVVGHADLITGWAVTDNAFFDQVADILPFRTSRGRLTLPEFLKLTGGTLYYVTEQLGSLQDQLLAEGHDVPVIEANWLHVTPFLHKFAAQHPHLEMVQLDGDAKNLMRPAAEGPFRSLLGHYRERGVRARVSSFRPHDVPALLLYPAHAQLIVDTRQALESGTLPSGIAGLIGEYADRVARTEEGVQGTLHLNASCPLIERLANLPPSAPSLAPTLDLIYHVARLFAGRTLSPSDATDSFHELGAAIEDLLR
jgi:molecular chaperone HtpG